MNRLIFNILVICWVLVSCNAPSESPEDVMEPDTAGLDYSQPFRPQYHFSPHEKWMNDPNGMVFYQGEYHLFYQYYPDSTVWGPMHWGHAVSTDLVHWEHLPIALYPDSLGYIFSGSAVVDWTNTSGFGTADNPPLVAIFTYHSPEREQVGTGNHQTQGIAYSLDRGRTWIKYDGNPVLSRETSVDFRDPKVFWHEASDGWVMVLAEADKIGFYGSKDLKSWSFLSYFGENDGSHTGVWECPDLFPLKDVGGNERWVLIVSIGTGGPMGSDTQYFVGNFDGTTFVNQHYPERTLWLDYGKDNYAGVTWSDVSESDGRRLFMGWMSNWQYAQVVPTESWRSSMTLPRELALYNTPQGYRVANRPVKELGFLRTNVLPINRLLVAGMADWSDKLMGDGTLLNFELTVTDISRQERSWKLTFSNTKSESLAIGFDDSSDRYYIDRGVSGLVDFSEDFAGVHYAPRISEVPQMPVSIWLDRSSIEMFADNGTVVMTDLIFPTEPYTNLLFETGEEAVLVEGEVFELKSIWQ